MAKLLQNAKQSFFDNNGDPLVGGLVYMYIPDTTTFKDTWQDSDEEIINTNPVELDSGGRAVIYGNGRYRQVLKDSLGNLIWDQLTDANTSDDFFGVAYSVLTPADGHSIIVVLHRGAILPALAVGSKGYCKIVATEDVEVDLQWIVQGAASGTSIGTVAFAAGTNTSTFTGFEEEDLSLAAGDALELIFPNPADATFRKIAITLKLFKDFST